MNWINTKDQEPPKDTNILIKTIYGGIANVYWYEDFECRGWYFELFNEGSIRMKHDFNEWKKI